MTFTAYEQAPNPIASPPSGRDVVIASPFICSTAAVIIVLGACHFVYVEQLDGGKKFRSMNNCLDGGNERKQVRLGIILLEAETLGVVSFGWR